LVDCSQAASDISVSSSARLRIGNMGKVQRQ
jgi:hypothetical protein